MKTKGSKQDSQNIKEVKIGYKIFQKSMS